MDYDNQPKKSLIDIINSITSVNISGRPERDIKINNDDILNLKIALYTTNSVEEFLRSI